MDSNFEVNVGAGAGAGRPAAAVAFLQQDNCQIRLANILGHMDPVIVVDTIVRDRCIRCCYFLHSAATVDCTVAEDIRRK